MAAYQFKAAKEVVNTVLNIPAGAEIHNQTTGNVEFEGEVIPTPISIRTAQPIGGPTAFYKAEEALRFVEDALTPYAENMDYALARRPSLDFDFLKKTILNYGERPS